MPSSNLDWEAIQTATQVARYGTLRGAAKAMGVHHTTAGRRIEQLEAALGARLFDRNPEGYAVTQEGEALVLLGRSFSDKLVNARRLIAGSDAGLSGTVTVTMAEPLFVELFAPRLSEFVSAYPDLQLDVATGFDFLDMARHEADVAIRMDNNPPETLVGKRLFAYRQTTYGAPDYLSSNDLTNRPENARWLGWSANTEAEPAWIRETEFPRTPVWGVFPTLVTQQAAASAGLGLTILPCLFGDADETLVRAGTRTPQKSRDIWLLTHSDLRNTARVRAFMEFAETVLRDAKPRIVGRDRT